MAWIHRAPATPISGLGDELGPTSRPRSAKGIPAVGDEQGAATIEHRNPLSPRDGHRRYRIVAEELLLFS
jgi:hypothetical protein